jgi:hypothetical protein
MKWIDVMVALDLNLGLDTNYHDWGLHGFSQSFLANAGLVPRLGHMHIFPNAFIYHLTLYNVATGSIVEDTSSEELIT